MMVAVGKDKAGEVLTYHLTNDPQVAKAALGTVFHALWFGTTENFVVPLE